MSVLVTKFIPPFFTRNDRELHIKKRSKGNSLVLIQSKFITTPSATSCRGPRLLMGQDLNT